KALRMKRETGEKEVDGWFGPYLPRNHRMRTRNVSRSFPILRKGSIRIVARRPLHRKISTVFVVFYATWTDRSYQSSGRIILERPGGKTIRLSGKHEQPIHRSRRVP